MVRKILLFRSFVLLLAMLVLAPVKGSCEFLADISQDGDVNLTDAILGLQLLTGGSPTIPQMTEGVDVDKDGKLGLPEVVFVLRFEAQLIDEYGRTLEVNTAPTFTVSDGKLTTDFGKSGYAQSVTVQADGKIVAAGSAEINVTSDFALARYNSNGSLDISFDSDGKLTTDIGGFHDYGYSVTVQADGKILVAGHGEVNGTNDFALARYNNNGSLDTSFDSDGKVATSFGDFDSGQSVTVQADGKILVAGYSQSANDYEDFALVRYNSNGSLDTSFDSDGKLTTDFGGFGDYGHSVTVQDDGKIVVAGSSHNANGTSDFALVRYNSDGSLDTSFDSDGKLTTDFGGSNNYGYSVTVQDDGKIVVAGASLYGNDHFALTRYNNDGSLDTSFDSDGKLTTALGFFDSGHSVTVQIDGKILVAGYVYDAYDNNRVDFALVRYNSNGSLDISFDSDGKLTTDFGGSNNYGYSVTVQIDGKILVAGNSNSYDNYTSAFALARYNSDGSLDTTFSPPENTLNGTVTYTEKKSAVILERNALISDVELSTLGNYNGATLTLSRNGGADAQDLFSAKSGGTLTTLTVGSYFGVDGVTIGRVTTNSAGTLILTFNINATQILVSKAMQQIAYANSSDAPSASIQIDWTFNDGNTGSQGTGGALSVTGSTTVKITAVNDAPVLSNPIPDIAATANTALNYVVPSNTFTDIDGDSLTYALAMSDGTAIPPWLTFNSSTRTLSGTPDTLDIGSLDIIVRATDGSGSIASDYVTITVTPNSQ